MGESVIVGGNDFSTHLITPPTQQNVVRSIVWLVRAILTRVHGVLRVWVVLERLLENYPFRKLAPHDERVADDVPLSLGPKEEQEFSQHQQNAPPSYVTLPDRLPKFNSVFGIGPASFVKKSPLKLG